MFKIEVFNGLQTRIGPSKCTSLKTQPFKTQPHIEIEDVTWWSPQYNLLVTRTSKRRALSLQEVESDGRFLVLHIVLDTCTIWFIYKFNMSYVFHFYILGSTSWIWISRANSEGLNFESPSKWNSYEGFSLEQRFWPLQAWKAFILGGGFFGWMKYMWKRAPMRRVVIARNKRQSGNANKPPRGLPEYHLLILNRV